jgi:hypothetical protein
MWCKRSFQPSEISYRLSEFSGKVLYGKGLPVRTNEVIFEVTESIEGGFEARALGYRIFTEAESWEHLMAQLQDSVRCHFGDNEIPRLVRVRVKDC